MVTSYKDIVNIMFAVFLFIMCVIFTISSGSGEALPGRGWIFRHTRCVPGQPTTRRRSAKLLLG